jgi:hypothetical protein
VQLDEAGQFLLEEKERSTAGDSGRGVGGYRDGVGDLFQVGEDAVDAGGKGFRGSLKGFREGFQVSLLLRAASSVAGAVQSGIPCRFGCAVQLRGLLRQRPGP